MHRLLGVALIVHGLAEACLAQSFTDDPLVSRITTIKAVHIAEVKSKIETLRGQLGLGAFAWTDPTLVPRVTPVNAADLIDLRTALSETYQKAGRPLPNLHG